MSPTLQILSDSVQHRDSPKSTQQKLDHFMLYEAQIMEQFGWKFVFEMENAWDDLHAAQLDDAFEQGFLAAFRLWMEISPALQTAPR